MLVSEEINSNKLRLHSLGDEGTKLIIKMRIFEKNYRFISNKWFSVRQYFQVAANEHTQHWQFLHNFCSFNEFKIIG